MIRGPSLTLKAWVEHPCHIVLWMDGWMPRKWGEKKKKKDDHGKMIIADNMAPSSGKYTVML